MSRSSSRRGSALLLATIIALLALGIGGAFLAEFLARGKTQHAATRSDEALMICDAGLERARRALYQYRFSGSWTWNDILEYCSKITETTPDQIKADFNARVTTPQFTAYMSNLGTAGQNTLNESATPADRRNPAPTDPTNNGVFIGWNIPYSNGAYHILVKDNADDTDPSRSPLVDADDKVVVVVTATLRDGTQRRIESTIFYNYQPLAMTGLAAILTNSDTDVTGNITVDGRDWDINGSAVVGGGVYGVMSSASITTGGSSGVGGNGLPPLPRGAAPGSLDPNHSFPTGYPPGPDAAVNARTGTLKSMAQASGTYFTTQAAYDHYIALNGGVVPGGQVIYLEATTSPPFNLGRSMNNQPSIIVVHNSTSTASIKNVHGDFKGVLFADQIDHVNAGTNILGMIQTFSDVPYGNALGNGNSTVKFSSAVLRNLPSSGPGACTMLDWKKVLQ
jgi:hypothetical protein